MLTISHLQQTGVQCSLPPCDESIDVPRVADGDTPTNMRLLASSNLKSTDLDSNQVELKIFHAVLNF